MYSLLELLPPRRLLSAALMGDFNDDGRVNSVDFGVLAAHWQTPADPANGDANGDGIVNDTDYNLLAANWGKETPPEPGGPPLGGKWNSVFDDEFDGDRLDPIWRTAQYWDHAYTFVGGDEWQAYDSTGVDVSDGALHLTAREESKYGANFVSGLVQTGGELNTPEQPTFSFAFGYIEVRAKFPPGQGLWPSIWMLPASHNDANGELDVVEFLGGDTSRAYFTTHRHGSFVNKSFSGPDFTTGYHTFGLDWAPDHVTWYVDGVPRVTNTDPKLICQEAMFPIMNVSVGGAWGGYPDANTQFPATMDVDYLRVWQRAQ